MGINDNAATISGGTVAWSAQTAVAAAGSKTASDA